MTSILVWILISAQSNGVIIPIETFTNFDDCIAMRTAIVETQIIAHREYLGTFKCGRTTETQALKEFAESKTKTNRCIPASVMRK